MMMKNSVKKMCDNSYGLKAGLQKIDAEARAAKEPFEDEDPNSHAGIYKATYTKDPRYVYIGQTKNDFKQRWEEHIEDFNHNRHCGIFGDFYRTHHCNPSDFKWEILYRVNPMQKDIIDELEKRCIREYVNNKNYITLNTIEYKEND